MNEDYMFEDEDNFFRKDEKAEKIQYEEPSEPKKESMGPALFSLILGLLALVFFLIGINIAFAIASIVLGIISITAFNSRRGKKFAIAGIIISVLSIVLCIGSWAFILSNADHIAVIANDSDTLDFLYDYYGIDEEDIYGDFFEEYPMFEDPSDTFPFEKGELNMDETL